VQLQSAPAEFQLKGRQTEFWRTTGEAQIIELAMQADQTHRMRGGADIRRSIPARAGKHSVVRGMSVRVS
jgi:hypothetical protein